MPIDPSQNSMNFRLATGANQPQAGAKPKSPLVAGSVKPTPFASADPNAKPPAAPALTGEPLQLYRHPADKNAAATAVQAGRVIDVQA